MRGKILRYNTYHHVSLDQLPTRLRYRLSSSDGANQSDQLSAKKQSDETLEDIKAITELEPSGIVHIAVFLCFSRIV